MVILTVEPTHLEIGHLVVAVEKPDHQNVVLGATVVEPDRLLVVLQATAGPDRLLVVLRATAAKPFRLQVVLANPMPGYLG